MVLVLLASRVGFLQVQSILSAMTFDVGWAQNWAQFSLLKVPTSESKLGWRACEFHADQRNIKGRPFLE
jgi:hypothetical protein